MKTAKMDRSEEVVANPDLLVGLAFHRRPPHVRRHLGGAVGGCNDDTKTDIRSCGDGADLA